jgi:hypothetical protein
MFKKIKRDLKMLELLKKIEKDAVPFILSFKNSRSDDREEAVIKKLEEIVGSDYTVFSPGRDRSCFGRVGQVIYYPTYNSIRVSYKNSRFNGFPYYFYCVVENRKKVENLTIDA